MSNKRENVGAATVSFSIHLSNQNRKISRADQPRTYADYASNFVQYPQNNNLILRRLVDNN